MLGFSKSRILEGRVELGEEIRCRTKGTITWRKARRGTCGGGIGIISYQYRGFRTGELV